MNTLKLIIQIIAAGTGSLVALSSILLSIRLRWPAPVLWFLKLYTSAVAPFLAVLGALCGIAGVLTGSLPISLIGLFDMLIFSVHLYRVTRASYASGVFEQAFGPFWEDTIHAEQKKYFLPLGLTLRLPAVPYARLEQNIPFSTIPGTSRRLLCDIWQPHKDVAPSGLAFIYLHGAAWYMLDKDLGTRPFFRHLAAQGHVVMDVAYRFSPETDMMGMVGDAKRAIVWMKENAAAYGVNPNRIVLGGGSSGAHLALMAAYTANNPQFTPKELEGDDLNVCAVISLYGPTDLKEMYYHLNQHLTTRLVSGRPKKAAPTQLPAWIKRRMGKNYYRLGFDKGFANAGSFAPMMGGHPDEQPEAYALFSPVTHVHPGCPPTLLVHGEHDVMAPVKTTRFLYQRLIEEKVPAVIHILPQTDHAFDLILPTISSSAHAAFYDVERFLALQLNMPEKRKEITAKEIEEYELSY